MRKLVTFVFAIGFIMLLGAAILAIDGFATDERRAAVDAEIHALADANEELSGRAGRRDFIGRTARIIRDLKNGLFFSAPVQLADLLPPAPEGWNRREYVLADGEAITGERITKGLSAPKTTRLLRAFKLSAERTGDMSATATYVSGARLIALRFESETDRFRSLKRPDSTEARQLLAAKPQAVGKPVLLSVDGIPVFQAPQFSTDSGGRPVPVAYRHFTLNLGHLVFGEIITNAADADLVAVLSGLSLADFQNALPRPTQHYAMGDGTKFLAGDAPSTNLPAPTPAMRAYELLGESDIDKREKSALIAIAQGRANDWPSLKSAMPGGNYPMSDRLLAVLGSEPTAMQASRKARNLLTERHDELAEAEAQVLNKIARAQAGSQAELQRYSWWSDDFGSEIMAIVALLPAE